MNILKLFGQSPFAPLQKHMEKVASCVLKLPELFDAVKMGDSVQIERVANEISNLEHAADLIKNDIRNHLPRSLFLSIDRSSLLEILSLQDHLADIAEDIAILTTYQPLQIYDSFKVDFDEFFIKNLETFHEVRAVISEMDELLESSFGGNEAEKVRHMIEEVSYREHEADLIQRKLLKNFYKAEEEISRGSFYLWQKIFENLAALANTSEKLAYRVRMTLELNN